MQKILLVFTCIFLSSCSTSGELEEKLAKKYYSLASYYKDNGDLDFYAERMIKAAELGHTNAANFLWHTDGVSEKRKRQALILIKIQAEHGHAPSVTTYLCATGKEAALDGSFVSKFKLIPDNESLKYQAKKAVLYWNENKKNLAFKALDKILKTNKPYNKDNILTIFLSIQSDRCGPKAPSLAKAYAMTFQDYDDPIIAAAKAGLMSPIE